MSRRLRPSFPPLAGATLLCVMATGLAHLSGRADAGSAASARRGGTLRLSGVLIPSVDPAIAYLPGAWQILYATCAKLFNYADAAGTAGTRLVPEVVDRFTVSKDGRTYTFALRRTFRFHTGAPVTAQSFAAAFNRDAQPGLASGATAYMREIVGAAAVIDGKAKSISGVRVLGDYRLRVRLTQPLGDFTARLTMPFFCPILPGTPIDRAEIDDPPGSGPYYVAERVVNQRIVLRRNPYYRGTRPANADEVVWTLGTRDDCLVAVEQDRVDYCVAGVPPTAYRRLAETYGINRPGGQFFVNPSLGAFYLVFNHDRPAFERSHGIPLEKAINYAIDRPAMARAYGYLAGKRIDQMLPPLLGHDERIYPLRGADPATGRKWLARAKPRPTELVLYATNDSESVEVAQVLAFELKQLGIDLEVKYFDGDNLGERIAKRDEPFDIATWGWNADYADAATFLVPLLGRGGAEFGVHLRDPLVDRRLAAANRLTGEARRRAWADLDVDLMRDNPPVAPYLLTQRRTFVSRSVGCFFDQPVYGFDFGAVCKK